ncbi:DUF2683 family protein [Mucilaginibacter gotjawali]|uniref:Uncharacterized membrane protein (DUF106 family) n=2 Tax=Mucilaginibacter gotjawali TaxID=1550579 RepID=A0A839SNW2_9SPHI|nr:DUF2683 family protein [Mucilaginibacter gotjawali]MBB3058894.1 uncharacterized membrane protein (DUF106 family) [Mucilaginibacter gotjawali]
MKIGIGVNHHFDKKYINLYMATLIVHPKDKEQLTIIKTFMKAFKISFEEAKSPYDPEFVAKIQESREQVKRGETREVNIADL